MKKLAITETSLVHSQFFRFLLTSGFAAFVNLGSRWVINKFASFDFAIVVSFCAGVTTAYALGKMFVFDNSGRKITDEFSRFLLINLIALVFVWAISVGLARKLFPAIGFAWHAEDVAHFIGVLSPAVISYFGHRSYTFAKTETSTLEARSPRRALF